MRLRWLATGAATLVVVASAAGAGHAGSLRDQVRSLRQANASLAAQSRSAVLQLYALESRLARADRVIARLGREEAAVRREERAATARLQIARRASSVAEQQLEQRLRTLYVDGDVDPLALLLGAQTLDDALTTLDHLTSLADQDRLIISQTQTARTDLRTALEALAARAGELAALTREAESARASLAAAKAERTAYIANLARQRRLNNGQIANLTAAAQAAVDKSQQLGGSGNGGSGNGGSGGSGGGGSGPGQMTVVATGYSLTGTTATGVQAGWGVVAVDPGVIPLGTRMTIPGYGEGVAADTGSAILGNHIDLWFPTTKQALAWGSRVLTITIR